MIQVIAKSFKPLRITFFEVTKKVKSTNEKYLNFASIPDVKV